MGLEKLKNKIMFKYLLSLIILVSMRSFSQEISLNAGLFEFKYANVEGSPVPTGPKGEID